MKRNTQTHESNMTKSNISLLSAFALFVLVAPARADDQKEIQGAWKIEKAVRGGQDMPAEEREKTTLEFKGSKAIVHHGASGEKPAEFTLDSAAKPKSIVIKPENEQKELLGIYELKGDTLKICLGRDGADRPKDFESKEGSKSMLLILKREKK